MDTRTKDGRNKRMDRSMGIIQSIYCKQNVPITIKWVSVIDKITLSSFWQSVFINQKLKTNVFNLSIRLQTKKRFYRSQSRTFEEHSEIERWKNERWRKRLAKFTSSRWVSFHLDFINTVIFFLEKNGIVSPVPNLLEINAQIPGIARFMFLVFRLFYAQV